jgi:toxin ParE1/3/4
MPRYLIAPAAVEDIESILIFADAQFGERARLRYEALLVRAIIDVADEPDRVGSSSRPEIATFVRSYHLYYYYSRKRVTDKTGRVKQPRHFLLYRARTDGTVEILRMLHDTIDLARHIPEEWRSGPDE